MKTIDTSRYAAAMTQNGITQQGIQARDNGDCISTNPYLSGSSAWGWWREGWLIAKAMQPV